MKDPSELWFDLIPSTGVIDYEHPVREEPIPKSQVHIYAFSYINILGNYNGVFFVIYP
jgi:hypothetical protein